MEFKSSYVKMLSDTLTPVSIYMMLRDKYAGSILLESSDYHGHENSFSYICCDPISSFKVQNSTVTISQKGQLDNTITNGNVVEELKNYREGFNFDGFDLPFIQHGLFGYMSYNAVKYFEDIDITSDENDIPEIFYRVFRYIVVVDHYKNQLFVFEHLTGEEESNLQNFVNMIKNSTFPSYKFSTSGEEASNISDEEYKEVVAKCRDHCQRGDVFQIVPGMRFERKFKGDEFNVYRSLRSLNPSPYLFYFDFVNFKIFGSSPEAQIVIKGDEASIHPIAGTFIRTGNDEEDRKSADELIKDKKENSEHVMLVDLARNDLSKNSDEVKVDIFKEVQFYSHVIHLVSRVTGKLKKNTNSLKLVADTFPAGTLSGAPKHMAMTLLEQYETTSRSYYGGAIGFMDFKNDFNHAIMIRSFLSRNNKLFFQAGAGVVSESVPEKELNEVNNKLRALRKAITEAAEID